MIALEIGNMGNSLIITVVSWTPGYHCRLQQPAAQLKRLASGISGQFAQSAIGLRDPLRRGLSASRRPCCNRGHSQIRAIDIYSLGIAALLLREHRPAGADSLKKNRSAFRRRRKWSHCE